MAQVVVMKFQPSMWKTCVELPAPAPIGSHGHLGSEPIDISISSVKQRKCLEKEREREMLLQTPWPTCTEF